MTCHFPHVAILGGGLLGGSLALALSCPERAARARLWARRQETADAARTLGVTGATTSLTEAVTGAKLVILAVPVGTMPELLTAALDAGLPHDCLVTDVGSVKQAPHQTLSPLLAPHGIPFIGSHPMAGSERTGIAAANADLFAGAACLLTNDDQAPAHLTAALESFWQGLGCHTSWLGAAAHDALVARISHFPHLVAAMCARIALTDPDAGPFGGGGLRDTTRVASGPPDMWAEILTENRSAILPTLRESLADLTEILACLESSDQNRVRDWLAAAKHRRDNLARPI